MTSAGGTERELCAVLAGGAYWWSRGEWVNYQTEVLITADSRDVVEVVVRRARDRLARLPMGWTIEHFVLQSARVSARCVISGGEERWLSDSELAAAMGGQPYLTIQL